MITKEQLKNIGFYTTDDVEYYDYWSFDYMFNIKTQKLYSHCEVYGDVEYLTIVNEIEKLKEILELLKK
jgi:hypothetical protein